jgi:ribosomal protein S12 methylthiotransferase
MDYSNYYLISLGCAKNQVDSDSIASLLNDAGLHPVEKPSKAELLIVNTCGFIEQARQESYRVLKDLANKKRRGQLLIATGCLTQRYQQEVVQKVKGIDGMLGTRRWMDIIDLIGQLNSNHQSQLVKSTIYHFPDTPAVGKDEKDVLRYSLRGASAYLKISDGCRRTCAFCAIPLIKGTIVSRPIEAILRDAIALEKLGVKEVVLIAQDSTDYGYDLGIKDGLTRLLNNMVQVVPNIPWIRIMYTYPGAISDHLIELISQQPQLIPYLDLPLQHAHPDVLRRMRRPAEIDRVYSTIQKMREAIPGLAIRSTFIVGFPGETDAEYLSLLDFIKDIRFDHVGAFTYSYEHGTPAEALGDPISSREKQARLKQLMLLQQQISLEKNLALVGKRFDVLVEGQSSIDDPHNAKISIGRSTRDAPEVDGLVIIDGHLPINQICPVQITGAMAHDLTAKPVFPN